MNQFERVKLIWIKKKDHFLRKNKKRKTQLIAYPI